MQVRTEDGKCPLHVFHPDEKAQWPGVTRLMDSPFVRQALKRSESAQGDYR